jgi:hypothetical protein
MDETTPKPADTDPRPTERWQSLVDILHLSQVTFLNTPFSTGKD